MIRSLSFEDLVSADVVAELSFITKINELCWLIYIIKVSTLLEIRHAMQPLLPHRITTGLEERICHLDRKHPCLTERPF